jgi:hypothetical protein
VNSWKLRGKKRLDDLGPSCLTEGLFACFTDEIDVEAKGYKLVDEEKGRLIFRREDTSVALIDKDKAETSADMTEVYLLDSDSAG